MSDVVTISSRLTNLEVAPQFNSYSKVRIIVSDDTVYEVGNDDGRTLEIENPFGTMAMATTILNSLRGFQYQPYQADGALLDPAAEIGDGANMRGSYGGIYTRDRNFGRLMKADISAPHDEEINHEYAYESPTERHFKRQIDDVKASLIIANDNIEAKVSQESPEGQTSFSWKLLSDSHKWYANGQEVMSISASGLTVKGNVQATTGTIGGFNISASAIWNNISSFGGNQSTGVYLGTNGIQLGQAFKVDTSGNVTATRLTVDTLYIGGSAVSAATLNARANNGNSAYSWTSSNGGYCTGGAAYGYNYNNATNGSGPSYFYCGSLVGNWVTANSGVRTPAITMGGYTVYRGTITISGTTYNVMRWR